MRSPSAQPGGRVARITLTILALLLAATAPVAARPSLAVQEGTSLADPVPFGDAVEAGPISLRVTDVVRGEEATTLVAEADPTNNPPRDGTEYVLVQLRVRNNSDRPLPISSNDFALTGSSGQIRRFGGVRAPEPALTGTVEADETREGWIALAAPVAEEDLLLLFDSLAVDGNWADRVLALEEGASLALPPSRTAANTAGQEWSDPAGLNTPIVTNDWEIELLEVLAGEDVFNLVDYRTGALGVEDAVDDQPWLALRLQITNHHEGDAPTYLPANAFVLVDEDGDPIPDVPTLTPPWPDASGAYDPGATREGWVAFELPLDYSVATVRFLPYQTDRDPRFLTYA